MNILVSKTSVLLGGTLLSVAVLYGGYLQYRVTSFLAESRPFLRTVLLASDTAHLTGGYWENTLIRVVRASDRLSPAHRAELYIGLMVLTDIDASRGYLFLTEVAKDEEGYTYLTVHHEAILDALGLSEPEAKLVRYWVVAIPRHAALRSSEVTRD